MWLVREQSLSAISAFPFPGKSQLPRSNAAERRALERPRLAGLDGFRVVAMLLVLVAHAGTSQSFGLNKDVLWRLACGPTALFFVLSGFLVTTLWLREQERRGWVDFGLFFRRRMYRLVPALVTFVACMTGLTTMGAIEVSPLGLLAPLVFVRNLFHGEWTTGHLWSLAMEEQFLLLGAALMLFAGIRTFIFSCTALVVLSPLLRVLSWKGLLWAGFPELTFPVLGDALAYGCLAAYANHRYGDRMRADWLWTGAALLIGTGLALPDIGGARVFISRILLISGAAVLLAACTASPHVWLVRMMESALVRRLAAASYSVYLWQQPFFDARYPLPGWLVVIGLPMVAWLSYRLVELPGRAIAPTRRLVRARSETVAHWHAGAERGTLSFHK